MDSILEQLHMVRESLDTIKTGKDLVLHINSCKDKMTGLSKIGTGSMAKYAIVVPFELDPKFLNGAEVQSAYTDIQYWKNSSRTDGECFSITSRLTKSGKTIYVDSDKIVGKRFQMDLIYIWNSFMTHLKDALEHI